MIVVMRRGALRREIEGIQNEIVSMGYTPHPIYGVERTVIGAIGDERTKGRLQTLATAPGVERVIPILKPYKLAGLEQHAGDTRIDVSGVVFGGKRIPVIAGPCSVESNEQIRECACAVKDANARMLRGGAYKPWSPPFAFQGLAEEGLKLLADAGSEAALPVVTEVTTDALVPLVAQYADMLQVGARNMQNFDLLKAVGRADRPVLLKRGPANTVREWLMSAEYVMSQGNMRVILCERGIRTFETSTPCTLDLNAVAVLKRETHLPVIVDPSHATGHWEYVEPMALAAIAGGADGLMIEVHPHPHEAWSDGAQSLRPDGFVRLMERAAAVAAAVGREI